MARNPDWLLFNKIFESYDKLKFQKQPCERLVIHARIGAGETVFSLNVRLRVSQMRRGISSICNEIVEKFHAPVTCCGSDITVRGDGYPCRRA